jgi:two-component system chemotaxis response regulator CheY
MAERKHRNKLKYMNQQAKTLRILVLDDYDTMLRIITNSLRQLGFQKIDEVTDSQAAVSRLRTTKYDLVISDWNPDHMTGLNLLKFIRREKEFKKLPFLMITGENEIEHVQAAQDAGANQAIPKPFNTYILKQKLTDVLGHF